MFIRVLAGFLAGLAAGIFIMRITYKKQGMIEAGETKSGTLTISTRDS
jgi:hypothetical protein